MMGESFRDQRLGNIGKIFLSDQVMTLNLLQVYEIKAAVQQVFGLEAQVWVSGTHQLGSGEIDLYIEADQVENVATKKRCFIDLIWDKLGCKHIDITIQEPRPLQDHIPLQGEQHRIRL